MKRWIALLLVMVLLLGGSGCSKQPKEIEISIMSQNVRLSGQPGEVDALYRSEGLIEVIEKYQPDVLGVQEYTPLWEFVMEDFIAETDYEIELKYRQADDEATAIIYNAKRLELLYAEHFWLSDTPEEESLSYDDTLPRICTRCDFKDKETGVEFTHINTHFGLTSYAQESSGTQINTYIKENLEGRAVFLTGDMNCVVASGGYVNITADDLLVDSSYMAEEIGEDCGTFNGFQDGVFNGPIDYIFVTPELVEPLYYSVLLDKPGGIFISDHYAVFAKCIVKNN